LQTLTGTLTAALHYGDALMVRLPLDETIYRGALQDADSVGNHERGAAIYEKMRGRFADDLQVRFGLGAEQYLTAEQYERQGQIEASDAWIGRAIKTLEGVVEDDPTPEHLQALGEILTHSGHFNQAETRLREAIQLDPQRALSYSDLADALMGRVGNENMDEPLPLDTAERKQIGREALTQLREAHRLDPSIPGIFSRMGAIYEVLEQHDDAILAFEEAVRHDPGDAEAYYTLGSLYLQRRQPERALPLMETAVQLAPVAIPFRLGLASCYALLNRVPEATREVDLIDRIQPGLPQVAELRSILKGGERRPERRR
ncbi:MAG: tetratricopeptide repeat protein, partial [Ktedonobacterales bacterium]